MKNINNKLKMIGAGFFTLIIFGLITGCVTYKNIYYSLENKNEKQMFYVLLYERTSLRIKQILNYPIKKRKNIYIKELKKISKDKNMKMNEYIIKKLHRIRQANMRFGTVQKGIFTPRGEIFVKYGEPSLKKYDYDDNYGRILIWQYSKYNKIFKFSYNENKNKYQLINIHDL